MTVSVICMGKIKLTRFPNTFRIEFSRKEFVCNKGHYSLDNIEKKRGKEENVSENLNFRPLLKIMKSWKQRETTLSTFREQIRKSIQGHWVMSGPSTWRDTPHHPQPPYLPARNTYTNTDINTNTDTSALNRFEIQLLEYVIPPPSQKKSPELWR